MPEPEKPAGGADIGGKAKKAFGVAGKTAKYAAIATAIFGGGLVLSGVAGAALSGGAIPYTSLWQGAGHFWSSAWSWITTTAQTSGLHVALGSKTLIGSEVAGQAATQTAGAAFTGSFVDLAALGTAAGTGATTSTVTAGATAGAGATVSSAAAAPVVTGIPPGVTEFLAPSV